MGASTVVSLRESDYLWPFVGFVIILLLSVVAWLMDSRIALAFFLSFESIVIYTLLPPRLNSLTTDGSSFSRPVDSSGSSTMPSSGDSGSTLTESSHIDICRRRFVGLTFLTFFFCVWLSLLSLWLGTGLFLLSGFVLYGVYMVSPSASPIRQDMTGVGPVARDTPRIVAQRTAIPPEMKWMIFQRDNYRCTYCGRAGGRDAALEVDHVIPVSEGGKTNLENLVTACRSCNRRKGASYYRCEGSGQNNQK